MTTTTSRAYVLPEDSDPVADLALIVRNLGQKLNDHVGVLAAGTVVVPLAASDTGDAAVVFPVGRFDGAPVIQLTSTNRAYFPVVVSPSASGCTARLQHRAGTSTTANVTVHWTAVEQ
jgi:hypothetical protein